MEIIQVERKPGDAEYSRELCEKLEQGSILILNPSPLAPPEENSTFMREQHQSGAKSHKNIAYKPALQKLTGAEAENPADAKRLYAIMASYSEGALALLAELLPGYAKNWKVDYASFRSFEEQGRDLPLSRRNDLMHVDAFPTRPTHGDRILRFFTNISEDRDRVWVTSSEFEELAEKYAKDAGLRRVTSPAASFQRAGAHLAKLAGMRSSVPAPYDQFMMGFHHYLKANSDFQKNGRLHTLQFAPDTSWMCFTDQIAHAVLSGQFALEQTCIISRSSMVHPEKAPIAVLEKLAGRRLAPSI